MEKRKQQEQLEAIRGEDSDLRSSGHGEDRAASDLISQLRQASLIRFSNDVFVPHREVFVVGDTHGLPCARGFAGQRVLRTCRDHRQASALSLWPPSRPSGSQEQFARRINSRAKTRHIETKYHYIHNEQREQGRIQFEYVPSADNLADVMTKSLAGPKHIEMTTRMNVRAHVPQN